MRSGRVRPWPLLPLVVLVVCLPATAFAQRSLHWDRFEVEAHLEADGRLRISETQTMVFVGEWNGGERTFDLRPRQKLQFLGMSRLSDPSSPLREDPSLDDRDEYAWSGAHTLRWRARLRGDPPFANTAIQYQLRYVLSNILVPTADGYRLNHDFAFARRDGPIQRFRLKLTLDPAWQPISPLQPVYATGPLAAGLSFVLNVELRHSGASALSVYDTSRSPDIRLAVAVLVGGVLIALVWFFVREQWYGRFAPLHEPVDEPWLREHVLKYPAEVVGAAWDGAVGSPEVVALIARLVSEGVLESDVGPHGGRDSMTLRLKVDRSTLQGHARTLVDGLFFDGRTETSTKAVRSHYHGQGFNPARAITRELEEAVEAVLPAGRTPRQFRIETLLVFIVGVVMIALGWRLGDDPSFGALMWAAGVLVVAVIGWIGGLVFRSEMKWRYRGALVALVPALIIAGGVSAFLWYVAGQRLNLQPVTVYGVATAALALALAAINGLKSRQNPDAIAFRKRLAAGKAFFAEEIEKAQPALRDEWYPWLLALELGKQADAWSTQHAPSPPRRRREEQRRWEEDDDSSASTSASSSTTSGSSTGSWTGFGGGRSGGAGGGASWETAALGMAAGVAAPKSSGGSSSGSDSSSSSDSSWSSDSSSSSSGGGSGGGW